MPNIIEAICPCCGKKANGKDEIESLFGWRTINNKTVPQSYCNKCRSSQCKAGEKCKVKVIHS